LERPESESSRAVFFVAVGSLRGVVQKLFGHKMQVRKMT